MNILSFRSDKRYKNKQRGLGVSLSGATAAFREFDKDLTPSSNLIGQKFGQLTVLEWAGRSDVGKINPHKQHFWICVCDCGDTDYNVLIGAWIR
ncbi:hypothetical protein [Nostoc sp.]|uniref:hypothetical protein n=1 Tax=Nostoc sp. TaxID=1180 RepID=UPI002FF9C10A